MKDIIDIANECLGKELGICDLDVQLFDLGLDSMDIIRLIVAIEKRHNIEFDYCDLEIRKIDTLRKLGKLTEQKVKKIAQ